MKSICVGCGKTAEGELAIWKMFGYTRGRNANGDVKLKSFRRCWECRRIRRAKHLNPEETALFCLHCEISIPSASKNVKFCSRECYNDFHIKQRTENRQKLLTDGEIMKLSEIHPSILSSKLHVNKKIIYNNTATRQEYIDELMKNILDNINTEKDVQIQEVKDEFESIIEQQKEYDLAKQEVVSLMSLDLLEGLTEEQKLIIKHLVEKKGYNPLLFTVDVQNDVIYYMGKDIFGKD